MEGILLILGLGYLFWLIIRHPLKSLGWVFKYEDYKTIQIISLGSRGRFKRSGPIWRGANHVATQNTRRIFKLSSIARVANVH